MTGEDLKSMNETIEIVINDIQEIFTHNYFWRMLIYMHATFYGIFFLTIIQYTQKLSWYFPIENVWDRYLVIFCHFRLVYVAYPSQFCLVIVILQVRALWIWLYDNTQVGRHINRWYTIWNRCILTWISGWVGCSENFGSFQNRLLKS